MPDSHLKSVEKVVDLVEVKNTATVLHGDSANTTTILNDVGDSATSFLLGKNVMMSSAGNIPIEEKSMATDVGDLVPGGNEHKTTEAPVLATSSSEISVPVKPSSEISVPVKPSSEMTAPALTMPPHHASVSPKKNCANFARYMAGFWLVRTALGITDTALCLFEIFAQTLGTPLLDPLNSLRRALSSVLDEPAESPASVLDEPAGSPASVLDEPAEILPSVLDEPVEILASVQYDPAENPTSVLDEPMESPASVLDEPAEILASVMDEPAESLASVMDEPVESPASVLDEPVESLTSVMDEPAEILASVLDEPAESLADAKVSSNTDRPIAFNHSPNDQVSGQVENDEDDKNPAHAMDDNEDAKNSEDATDEPILKNEIRKSNMSIEGTEFEDNNKSGAKRNSSEREVGTDDAGPKTTEVKGRAGIQDFKESSTNSKYLEEFEEEVLRKSIAQAVKDVEPIKLNTYKKRVDDIIELESTNISNNFEECDIEAIDTTDDFKTEDDTLVENSYDKELSLDEPPPQSSFFQDQYYPLLLEHTFLGPPAPAPASAKRYPGFRHLFVYEPYQTRYGSLGPVEDLLDDIILGAVQLSSTRDDPADYPLPEDSFDSSFENNEF